LDSGIPDTADLPSSDSVAAKDPNACDAQEGMGHLTEYRRYPIVGQKETIVDDLDRSIARRTAKNPRYPEMLQAEVRRQRLIAALIAERKANHLTQAQVAAEMNVSQSVVSEIESSKADVRYSTLDRYAEAVTKHKKRLDLTPA
jgi:DNA-binding transcriptional regulator YiaG